MEWSDTYSCMYLVRMERYLVIYISMYICITHTNIMHKNKVVMYLTHLSSKNSINFHIEFFNKIILLFLFIAS